MTDILQYDLTIAHAPRISAAQFSRVLVRAASPAAPDAAKLYAIPPTYGLDSAIALAFFRHESSCGTQGIARTTLNWGNLRRSQGRAVGSQGGFAKYARWADSLHDWCVLIRDGYLRGRKLSTVRQVIPIYAPSSDGNAPERYADSVMADVARWMVEDQLPADSDRTYRVKAAVTGGATIRAAPRQNGAVLGRLHAGDPWTGERIAGGLVTLAGFGSTNIWIRSFDLRCVWSGLLEEMSGSG